MKRTKNARKVWILEINDNSRLGGPMGMKRQELLGVRLFATPEGAALCAKDYYEKKYGRGTWDPKWSKELLSRDCRLVDTALFAFEIRLEEVGP